jgi:hypothetical protein
MLAQDANPCSPRSACLTSGLGISARALTLRTATVCAGIQTLAQRMGARLEHLHVEPDTITEHYVYNDALCALAAHCPNLRSLSIATTSYKATTTGLTSYGLLLLLGLREAMNPSERQYSHFITSTAPDACCHQLEKLVLRGCRGVDLRFFDAVADRKSAGSGLALKQLHVSQSPALESAPITRARLSKLLHLDFTLPTNAHAPPRVMPAPAAAVPPPAPSGRGSVSTDQSVWIDDGAFDLM